MWMAAVLLVACSTLVESARSETIMLIGMSSDNTRVFEHGASVPLPPLPPLSNGTHDLLDVFGLGFVSGECVTGPDPTIRAHLPSASVSALGVHADSSINPVQSVMYECVSSTRMRVSIFSDTNCINVVRTCYISTTSVHSRTNVPAINLDQPRPVARLWLCHRYHTHREEFPKQRSMRQLVAGKAHWTLRCGRTR